MKSIQDLLSEDESAIFLIREWVASSNNKNQASILPSQKECGINELLKLQITTKSVLGAIAYHTGGITLQNGWLRILGSGHITLSRTIDTWNKVTNIENMMLVADDVIGGFFAMNGGYLPHDIGSIFYLAPDTLEWESINMSYSQFIYWTITGDLDHFYEPFRWNGWTTEIEIINVDGDQGVSFYPFLWSKESNNIDKCSKKIVPIEEIWNSTIDFRNQLNIS